MIQHAHREGGIEQLQVLRQIFHTHWKQVDRYVVQIPLHRQELEHEQQARIDTHNPLCPGSGHPPAVIAGAAAHIQDSAPVQVRQVRGHTVPFPVRTPFGINVGAEKLERAFAPGHQAAQALLKAFRLLRRKRLWA